NGPSGSGKSTILLAIEFALFGLIKGDVDGSALLRNGAREGSVELVFMLDKQYRIHRGLKRGKDTVSQTEGWIEVDGSRTVAMPTEMRATILALLGYPKSFLTKSKSFLFRYTVFTPQEEMKRILFEEKEARLDTVRRVFDVDKYQRIKENALIVGRELREQKRHLDGVTQDLESKKQILALKEEEYVAVGQKVVEAKTILDLHRADVAVSKEAKSAVESAMKEAVKAKAEFAAAKQMLAAQEMAVQRATREEEHAKQTLAAIGEFPETRPVAEIKIEKDALASELNKAELAIRESLKVLGQITSAKSASEQMVKAVGTLNDCPTCHQLVSADHKHAISTTENKKISEWAQNELLHVAAKNQWELRLIEVKQKLEATRTEEQQALLSQAKSQTKKHLAEQVIRSASAVLQAKEQVEKVKESLAGLELTVKQSADVEQQFIAAQRKLEEALQKERSADVQYNRLAQEQTMLASFTKTIKTEVAEKLRSREKRDSVAKVQTWVSEQFVPLMEVMERHVLSRVYEEFNSLFQHWFAVLIEDELLSARLDDSFSPIISQNGYELDVSNLSGGEKTACALAYRLALNKVVNDLVNTIATKDLIILDEPTDGFSSEQLDKIRDVLDELHMRQIVLVSHESKIESMVDTVIRIQKEGHVSKIVV
ncbi:MAG: AAA family ATPase, partial [Nanoarchaeota archaeon]